MIKSAIFNKRAWLQSASYTTATDKQRILTWTDSKEIWISLRPLSGSESVQANQLAVTLTHEIKTRYNNGPITTGQRFRIGNRIFDIDSIFDEDEKHVVLVAKVFETKGDANG